MLQILRESDDVFVLVSDDANAENTWITESLDACAPELLEAWDRTKVSDDGLLRFRVQRGDWDALADAMEDLSCVDGTVAPGEMFAILSVLREALG